MSSYDSIASLELEIESYELEALQLQVSPTFTRHTTVVRLRGRGEEGIGEDVTWDPGNQLAFQSAGATQPLAGTHTLDSFSELVGRLNLFPDEPSFESYRTFRRWAFESAALDLALRQAGRSLGDVLERTPAQVTFVASKRLDEPPSIEPLHRWLEQYPWLRLKLDPTSSWDEALLDEIAATGAVDTLDFKGFYPEGVIVYQAPDPDLYERVLRALPATWIEDPHLTPEVQELLTPHRDRVTWDAPIDGVASIESLPYPPRMLNFKPSRFLSIKALFDAYDFCDANGIGMYGGGQFELGPGRGQIQYLAAVFHPHTPNDVAPGRFNAATPPPGLPRSPLPADLPATGFHRAV